MLTTRARVLEHAGLMRVRREREVQGLAMAFTTKSGYVRVDIFRASGKWYATAAVDMSEHYHDDCVQTAVFASCMAEFEKPERGQWQGSVSPRADLEAGFMLVCLEPYHERAHPVLLRGVPRS